ncbi:MAG: zinc metalloprotease HtpX [Anaerolineales bacterium]|nr:zinc metalloprotease HtpX [Anaerolineales bacterium]MCB9126662.1 zinc metalloprotease HtpX [Ardenticatenales bacterium]MCB9171798.1 zinc metalloprotease HtpX [Ardenticatenales bacterium]
MKQKWYGGDMGLQARMFVTLGLLSLVYLAFMAAMFAAGIDSFLILIFAVVMLAVQYFFSDKLVMASSGAQEVSPQQAPELHAIVDRLVQAADLPKPKVAVVRSAMPNAFATGRSPSHATVVVTEGLLRTLNGPELEAVLAHELAHIKNRDVAVITIASFFATVAQFVLRFGAYGGAGRRRNNDGGGFILFFGASILTWVISFFLIRALSRYREYAADRGAALLTGSPAALMSALTKISGTMTRVPQKDLREVEGLNAFFIIPAETKEMLFELFSTHPTVENRLAYLDALSREMEAYR